MIQIPTPFERHRYNFEEEISSLAGYLTMVNDFIRERIYSLENSIKSKPKFENDEEEYEWDEQNHWKELQKDFIEKFLRSTYFHSCLVTIISFAESQSISLCNFLYEEKHFKPLKPIKRYSILEQAKKHLEINLKASFKPIKAEWKEILLLRDLRNDIVHNNSTLKKSNKELKAYLEGNSFVSVSKKNDSFYVKDIKFLAHTIKVIEQYFQHMFSIINSLP